ncbi:PilZ domain-containing protein [Shewanella corallii]|uniref:PilZ domain-containing protein n=1 Tax=Shewanella corallii TaxID=560080 RepID=A0ABT0N6X0_9GAMM|nr:PilZ domain-containing protein [Shewanella corallii]MCL2914202.1 PilZ domain-containing protein [Shewanella corallii]
MVDLVIRFDTIQQLYRAYMPFVRSAGLFVATSEPHYLGETLNFSYRLPGDSAAREASGCVVWINPQGASGGRPAGIGVQFAPAEEHHRHDIEQVLSSELASGNLTSTM